MKIGIGKIIIAAAAIVALTLAWRSVDSTRNARESLAALTAQNIKLNSEVDAARSRLASTMHDEGDLQTALREAQARHENSNISKLQTSKQPTRQNQPDLGALMQTNPELRELFKRKTQANLAFGLRSFYDSVKLSSEKIRQFEAITIDAEQDKIDLQSAASAQGLTNNDPQFVKMRQQLQDKLQVAQKDILGDAGYQELARLQRMQPIGYLPYVTALLVDYTSDSLTVAQEQLLLEAVAASSSTFQKGGKADLPSVDWSLALPKAQALLTPAQYAAFKANAQGTEALLLLKQFAQEQKTAAK